MNHSTYSEVTLGRRSSERVVVSRALAVAPLFCSAMTKAGRQCKGTIMVKGLCHRHFFEWYGDTRIRKREVLL